MSNSNVSQKNTLTNNLNTKKNNISLINSPSLEKNSTMINTSIKNNKTSNSQSNTPLNTKTNVNTTKKEVSINNALDKYQSNQMSNETIKTTKEEMVEYGSIIMDNYLLLLGITSALIICLIIYFFSESFRVGRTIDKMIVYQGFQRITSVDYIKFGELRLGDMYVASAYNAAHSGYQMYDYTSKKIVLSLLQSGARYLEFNVFNSVFGEKAIPVVSMGYKKGEWKMMVTDTPLEIILEIIATNAFIISDGKNGVNNPEDPLFIGLNLNTNSNLSCLNLISMLILKNFRGRFLPSNYTFQNNGNIAEIPLIELIGKVVFFSSDGYQGSGLEEIINCCWDNVHNDPEHNMQRIHYSTFTEPGYDASNMIEYNKTGLTIVVPHIEGDFLNTNYDTLHAFETGCHFISMEFQYINNYMDSYITRFKDNSIIAKNKDLQKNP